MEGRNLGSFPMESGAKRAHVKSSLFYLPGEGDCGANPRRDIGGVSGAQSRGNLGSPY